MNIYDEEIRIVGRKLIEEYKETGKVKCGINGPYDDEETEVRDLSHLIIITAIEILKYNQSQYKDLIRQMGHLLLDMQEIGGLYIMRIKNGKDQCNGVIGHAWVLEAMVYLYKVLNDGIYLEASYEIVKKHKFQSKVGLWGRPGMGDEDADIDYTLNHQLWYAASLYELNVYMKSELISEQLKGFMKQLQLNFINTAGGKIAHSIYRRINIVSSLKNDIKKNLHKINEKRNKPSYAYKEEGYHLFNLMALARIYNIAPEDEFFLSRKFNRAIDFINRENFLERLLNTDVEKDASFQNMISNKDEKDINIYGYPYNVPGFELLYVSNALKSRISGKIVEECIKKQFDLTYSAERQIFGEKCHDKVTINYRIYEYYRYLENE